jgi:hypothetical protein
MDTKNITDLVNFSEDGPVAETLYETPRLWSQVVCLDTNQQLGPITDADSDGLFTVIAGEVVIQVNRGRRRAKQWTSTMVEAGDTVTVTNATGDPAVVLIVAAPPPVPRPVVEPASG